MNLAFIHIPKNAGNTVRQALNLRNLAITEKWKKPKLTEGHVSFGHTPLRVALDLMSDEFRNDAYIFTFSRNPFDRAVSIWAFQGKRRQWFAPNNENFLEYTKLMEEKSKEHLVLRQQSYWVLDNWYELSFVGRVEDIDEGLWTVADAAGLTIDRVPVANSTVHKPYQEYYCPQARDNVLKAYEIDFETFGYSTEL